MKVINHLSSFHKPVNTTFIIVEILHSSDVYYSLHLTYLISMDATVMVVHYSAMTDVKGELSTYSTAVAQLNYSSARPTLLKCRLWLP